MHMSSPKAQYKLAKLVRDIRDRSPDLTEKFKYKPREEKQIDWTRYTEAQVDEIYDYLVLVKNMADEAERRMGHLADTAGKVGRPPKSAFDKAKAILIQQYFEVSNRVAAGLIKILNVGIKTDLTYKDIERAYSNPHVLAIMCTIFDMCNEPVRDRETRFSIDGSGLPNSIKQNYANEKRDSNKVASYDMFIGMIGVRYKLFSAFDIVNGNDNECPYLIPLLKETSQKYDRIDAVSADSAYISRANCSYIASLGAKPRIFPKENVSMKARGSIPWRLMFMEFVHHTQKWLEEFHLRSISETGNGVLKGRFTRPLLKRSNDRRIAEGCFKVTTYNVRRLSYLYHLENVEVKWLNRGG